jgi:hypothetical protein
MGMTSNYTDDSPTQPVPVLRPGSRLNPGKGAAALINQPEQAGSGQLDNPHRAGEVQSAVSTQAHEPDSETAQLTGSSLSLPFDQPQSGLVDQPSEARRLGQDLGASTPVPLSVTPRPSTLPVAAQSKPRHFLPIIALAIAGISLILNVAVITQLLRARNQVNMSIDNAAAQLEAICNHDARVLTFPISQTIRFQGDIPIPQGLVIPFKGNIPFRTTLRVETFPGGPVINVPINTIVPVDTKVPIPDSIVIPVDTTIPFRQDIPIDLCTEASPFRGLLGQFVNELRALQDGF